MLPASASPTALLLIDIQQGMRHATHWGPERSTPEFESKVESVLQAARAYNQRRPDKPVLIIHPTTTPRDWPRRCTRPPVAPEPVLVKDVNSAFIGTDLEVRLRAFKTAQLVVLGLSTDECVSSTVRMAANLKLLERDAAGSPPESRIVLLSDATAAWAKGGFCARTIHEVHLASLNGEFARVETTEDAIEAVLR
ncbi:hypothetical protein H634G_03584 [Metarhizium anisopliae BRIP 53293]|uniref:Isochorismatase-like domain-containing protein n=1 Tax=Metarhizium anisopliae BRIP 53293 TaxID=1291518 RepID=A0A0D9P8D0_METAN|nr:hypothetical protein H634G_03584 [Metarhizium anisopliae BRIP 53293]KJK86455.1 hypothetical protein H633G_09696 [Metarhizium anisopliae BRIP 53284]